METENLYETFEESKLERDLNGKQGVLNEIARDYTNTLKSNYKVSKTWFKRKFEIIIKKKSGELVEKRAICRYYPTKRKTKIGPTDDCDIFLASLSQSILVIKQTDSFATVFEVSNQVPRKGARLELPDPTPILPSDLYRIGKIFFSIMSLTPSTLSVSIDSLANNLQTNLSKTTKIGSYPGSDIEFSDRLAPNFLIELQKGQESWTIHNLSRGLILWKYLSGGKKPSKRTPLIHSLSNNQVIHLGGSIILLE